MSILDKVVGAITPPVSDETRMQARADARKETTPGDWLYAVLDHHDQIEAAFATVKTATSGAERTVALKELGILLTGHSIAEEVVLYPNVADSGHKAHAAMAYEEQSMAKIEMALLEKLAPMSQDFDDKLEHLQGAVTTHMYQEETSWFLDLKREVPKDEQAKLAQRYTEEVERYSADAFA